MGFSIGRLFGTDIRATGGFFLLVAFYFLRFGLEAPAEAAIVCIAVILSLLVHEFGHVFAVRWQLKSESAVILWGLGGLCVHPPAPKPSQRLIISLMGPAFEAVLGIVAIAVWFLFPPSQPLVRYFVGWLVWINVVWLVFNLVPLKPLDGGQALEAAMEMKLGSAKAATIARRVSVLCAAVIVAAGLYYKLVFLAVMGLFLLIHNLQGRPRPL